MVNFIQLQKQKPRRGVFCFCKQRIQVLFCRGGASPRPGRTGKGFVSLLMSKLMVRSRGSVRARTSPAPTIEHFWVSSDRLSLLASCCSGGACPGRELTPCTTPLKASYTQVPFSVHMLYCCGECSRDAEIGPGHWLNLLPLTGATWGITTG